MMKNKKKKTKKKRRKKTVDEEWKRAKPTDSSVYFGCRRRHGKLIPQRGVCSPNPRNLLCQSTVCR
jgi:hypothetical protein